MSNQRKPHEPGRREFLNTLGASAAGLVIGACGKCTSIRKAGGSASNAEQTAALLPAFHPMEIVKPDIVGDGGAIPDGFFSYPKQRFQRVVGSKPGRGGRPISSKMAVWGPNPPSLERNQFVQAVNRELGVTVNPTPIDGMAFADKLSAILGARDVPDIISVPTWEIDKIPRISLAIDALFEELTGHLQGESIKDYPLLATIPTSSWQYCVWNDKLAAIPFPTDGVFPYAMFYRKDILDQRGIEIPTTVDELYRVGKQVTNPKKSVWAFGEVFDMAQMYFGCPGLEGGFGKGPDGGLIHKYETKEYRAAVEFAARIYKEGLVHPDMVATKGADGSQLFKSGRILMLQDGVGGWRDTQRDQVKINPAFNMQPLPLLRAGQNDPVAWGVNKPIFYTFVKKGLPKGRTQEILRVLDWCAAPFGSFEWEMNQYGVEGKHFERGHDHSPVATDLGQKEIKNQFRLISGRAPVLVGSADIPNYVKDLLEYTRATAKYLEEDLFAGIKLEKPASYSKILQATEDKIKDVVRGRRPISDLKQIVENWRRAGGNDTREFLEKALRDNGRL